MKKIIIIIFMSFLLTGCFDYVEVDDLVILTGMIIDYKDNNFEVTSQLIKNEGKSEVQVLTTTGTTIEECIAKISKLSNKDIFISHLKVLIVTENVIKNNIDFYDYFLREPKSKMNFYVYTISDKDKDKVFKLKQEDIGSSMFIKDMMDFNNKIFSSSTPVSFLDLIYKKLENGIEPIYPNLIIKKNNDKDILYLENLIIYNDNKDKIVLNDEESVFYNLATHKVSETVINIPCSDNDKNFSLNLYFINSSNKWKDNTFNINVSTTGKISTYECKSNLDNNKTIEKLNELTNKYIEEKINHVVNIAKKNKADFLGIGNYIYKHDPKYFDFDKNDWNKNLEKINVNVNVETTIKFIGEIRK